MTVTLTQAIHLCITHFQSIDIGPPLRASFLLLHSERGKTEVLGVMAARPEKLEDEFKKMESAVKEGRVDQLHQLLQRLTPNEKTEVLQMRGKVHPDKTAASLSRMRYSVDGMHWLPAGTSRYPYSHGSR